VLLAQQGVDVGYGVAVFGLSVRRWDLLVLVGLVWAVTLLCAGAALATVVNGHSGLSAATDIGGLFLTVVGGAMVPLRLMPSWVTAVAPVSPGYWALTGLRAAIGGDTSSTLRSAAVLAGVAGVLGAFAGWRVGRGWGHGRPSS
jgi:ABC-2 type transport system permease protein